MSSILKTFPFALGYGRHLIKTMAINVFVMPEKGLNVLHAWEARLRERQHLARLDLRILDDMGMSPEDAARESAKPFWRA
ncbi:MAG: DUF1127 domain-containing protein [Rhodospirillales bacterium]|nr:DUF1127 domain-containing protein [Rhodospirillales bacterium]MBO6787828.1 DUF1127 domain-containing protein [Rhodospirillales bacterium]